MSLFSQTQVRVAMSPELVFFSEPIALCVY